MAPASRQPEKRDSDKLDLQDVQFIQLRYTDVPGRFLAKYVFTDGEDPYDQFRAGVGVDGSSVRGFASIDESDMLLVPDRSTLRLVPTMSPRHRVAAVIADVYQGFGKGRLARDPRHVSQRMEEHLMHEGLACQVGPEVECFIFDEIVFFDDGDNKDPEIVSSEQSSGKSKYPIRRKGGYDAPPFQDSLVEFRFDVAEILKKHYGIRATNLNHEVASSGQIEINFMHDTLTKAADNVQIYKDVVRNVARQHGKVANFMPKPIFDENDPRNGDNGSGMHVSVSLWKKAGSSGNIFYDANDEYAELSQAGRYFIGGVLSHAPSLAAIVAPTVNSYYRMVPGFEAPVYVAWSRGNRSAIVRVPVNERNNARSKRVEFRAPDPSANPYLAFSAIVAAGLDGIRKKVEPGDPVNEDIYKMSASARSSLGIKSLPGSLEEALQALKSDSGYLQACFYGELLETYMELKKAEAAGGRSKRQQFMLYYDI
ncbi:type I glutamate--ammonia ligase [Nitrososphaera sp.]|uniref:type I glutamate--ammonia ligase n=1 Tax=Nitrososphaera sp. TaxID=1971748 RepID=UPI00307F2A92